MCCCLGQIAKHSVDLAEVVVEAEVFPNILKCLRDSDLYVRKNAATCIREIAKHTPEVRCVTEYKCSWDIRLLNNNYRIINATFKGGTEDLIWVEVWVELNNANVFYCGGRGEGGRVCVAAPYFLLP